MKRRSILRLQVSDRDGSATVIVSPLSVDNCNSADVATFATKCCTAATIRASVDDEFAVVLAWSFVDI